MINHMTTSQGIHFVCIRTLQDGRLYTPATIAMLGHKKGILGRGVCFQAMRLRQQQVRICLTRLALCKSFPKNGDGIVRIRGQAPMPGWFGFRWKMLLP